MSSLAAPAPAPPPRPPASPQAARLPPRELFGTALQGLRTRKLRAALSALGIAIGIGAMVAVVGVSASSQAQLLAEIDALGTNLLTATPGTTFSGNNEILPKSSVPMVGGMRNVNSDVAVYQVSGATVLRSPVRARAADGRNRRRRRRAEPGPGDGRIALRGALPRRGE